MTFILMVARGRARRAAGDIRATAGQDETFYCGRVCRSARGPGVALKRAAPGRACALAVTEVCAAGASPRAALFGPAAAAPP